MTTTITSVLRAPIDSRKDEESDDREESSGLAITIPEVIQWSRGKSTGVEDGVGF